MYTHTPTCTHTGVYTYIYVYILYHPPPQSCSLQMPLSHLQILSGFSFYFTSARSASVHLAGSGEGAGRGTSALGEPAPRPHPGLRLSFDSDQRGPDATPHLRQPPAAPPDTGESAPFEKSMRDELLDFLYTYLEVQRPRGGKLPSVHTGCPGLREAVPPSRPQTLQSSPVPFQVNREKRFFPGIRLRRRV